MMNVLQGIGLGIVGFAVIVVIGIVIVTRVGDSVAECGSGYEYNVSQRYCQNATNFSQTTNPANSGWTNSDYLSSQLGSNGLAGWIPAVIAVVIGGLFLAYFGGKKRKAY